MTLQFHTGPAVSVIITNYHQQYYIGDAINSVYHQTYRNWELIIVDDSNGEDELEAWDALRTKVYKTRNIGSSKARNYGASFSKGKYILFLDADDKIHPQYLEKTVKVLEENPDISIAYPDTEFFGGDVVGGWVSPEYDFKRLTQGNFMVITSLIRRKDFIEVGGYDPDNFNYWEDYELWLTLGDKGHYGKHVPEKLFYYRVHGKSSTNTARANQLTPLYQSYVISKFPEYYSEDILEKANKKLMEYPKDFMSWNPKQQEEYLLNRS